MNRRQSNRHNPFKGGPPNQGNMHDFQQEPRNASQSHNRTMNTPFNHNNRNVQHNDFQQESHSQNKSYNETSPSSSTLSPPQSAPRSGPCVMCKSTTVLICSRCGDFYCSPTCQKNDWQTHRFICFLMPKLVPSSFDIYQNVPALNGYQNRELCETSPSIHSQNKKWVNNSSPTPSVQSNYQHQRQQPNMHQQQQNPQQMNQQQQQQHQPIQQQQQPIQQQRQLNQNQQQRNQQQQQQHQPIQQQQQQQPNQRPQNQNQNQNNQRQNPPTPKSSVNGSEKAYDPNETNKATNIGKVEQAPFPKSGSSVLVTAIRSSNRIFLRSIEKAENDGYLGVVQAINEYGRNATPLKVMPTKNAFAITDFQNDGLYYRVQVISAKDENNIKVIYFDFGNEGTKKLSQLKDISMACAALKQYVVMATLKNVPFLKDNPKLIEYMKTFEDIEAKIVYSDREKPSCEIMLDGVEDSLNKKVNIYIQNSKNDSEQQQVKQSKPQAKDEPKPEPVKTEEKQNEPEVNASSTSAASRQQPKSRPSQFAKPVMVPPFEQIVLPIKATNIEVMIVDNSLLHYNCFGCVLVEDKANLQEIQNYLVEYKDTGREYKPKIEEYCLAKYQDGWYRAKVLDILPADIVEVVFIDFLNESEVSVKDIRRYPMDLDLPCKTTLCLIQGLPNELTDGQVEYLKDKLQPGRQLKINEVVEKHPDGSDIAVCRINQVTQWMAEDKP